MNDSDDISNTLITSMLKQRDDNPTCELCSRHHVKLTRHHLIPRARHNKTRTKRQFSKTDMTADIAMLCRPCHSQIHRIFSNHQLSDYYHTLDRLKTHPEVIKFVNWISKRPPDLRVRVKR